MKTVIFIAVFVGAFIIGLIIGYLIGKEKDPTIGDMVFNLNDASKETMEIHIKEFPYVISPDAKGAKVKLNFIVK